MPSSLIIPSSHEAIASSQTSGLDVETSSENAIPAIVLDDRKGWLVIFGSAMALFSTTGIINAYGFFQAYYTATLLSKSSSTTISLIGALQIFLVYGGGPIAGKLFDVYGLSILFPAGSMLVVLALMLISICEQDRPYQFFLVQGVLFGVGNSMIFTPAVAVTGHWFRRQRAYAMGVIVAGSSLGGVIYPIMLNRLQEAVGFAWAVRIAGFLTAFGLLLANLMVKTQFPKQKQKQHVKLSQLVDIYEYAKFNNVSSTVASYLLAIINFCGIPARIIPGFLGDRFGILEILVPSTLFSGCLVLALWLPARGEVPIILFSALYGLFSSSFVSMIPAYIATITPAEHFGARTLYLVVAVACLVGTPTAGVFVPRFSQSNFDHLIIFTGALLLVAGILMGIVQWLSRGQIGESPPQEAMHCMRLPCSFYE
ncbi:hypothetical protein Clacol_002788 [Clathrus columnatus]|uniref:Major facilitator superfamily (MFS) profile domain-containing protein n=1 Tax=Clathrus columnatus TaxID=1419009 RepID=A0AAV5A5Q5_9AGAM|nr:hypothetical protein Clacol_002788 [Clathrus columnatus]